MSEPLVHVVIVNWKGRPHVEECFDSLLAGSYGNVRFVLVDNASEDGSLEFVESRYGTDERVEIVRCGENLGWSGGNNVGVERALDAGADYIFLLNDDTSTAPDAIEKLVSAAEEQAMVGALAPKMVLFDNPAVLNSVGAECSVVGAGWDRGIGRLDGERWNERRDVLAVCGGACFLRAEAVRKAGPLPSDFTIYLDDIDLCLRIWDAGYAVRTCPEAVVRHKFSATMGHGNAARRKYYLSTRNRLRLILRNFPVSKLPFVAGVYAVAEARAVGRALLDGDYWKVPVHVRTWFEGLAYGPKAIAARRERRRRGLGWGRFWALVRRRPFFFSGTEFPKDGWYAPRAVGEHTLCPISTHAVRTLERSGRLRVVCADCYPQLGEVAVEVRLDGRILADLRTSGREERIVEIPAPGALELVARRVFDADDTGEKADFGGWVGLEWV